MDDKHLRNAVYGTLLGMATGDALGCPMKGDHRYEVESKYGILIDFVADPAKGVELGQWGLHTAQAMAVLEAYTTAKEFDGGDIALRLLALSEDPKYQFDRDSRAILEELAQDPESWKEVAARKWCESGGIHIRNTALARCTIPALAFYNDMPRMIEDTVKVCHVTHYDPRCVDAAIAVNFLISQCLHNRFNPDLLGQCTAFLENLQKQPEYRELVLDYDEAMLHAHPNMTPMPSYEEDRDMVVRELRLIPTLTWDDLSTSDSVIHTMQTAVWALFHADGIEEGVSQVASLGGQADAQGALAGALLGARFGFYEIPVKWMKMLAGRARIINLGEFLLSELEE